MWGSAEIEPVPEGSPSVAGKDLSPYTRIALPRILGFIDKGEPWRQTRGRKTL